MIEVLVGLAFLVPVAWFIWGMFVLIGSDPFYLPRHTPWYDWVAVTGAFLGFLFAIIVFAYIIGWDVLN